MFRFSKLRWVCCRYYVVLRRMRFGGFCWRWLGLGVGAARACGLIGFVRWVYVLWVSWFGFPD